MRAPEAFGLLRRVGLPLGHFAVFGSGPLLVRGIIDEADDLDVIARGPAWRQAVATGTLVDLEEHGVTVASFFGGAITVGNRWAIGDVSVDALINSAEMLDGLPFVQLEHVRSYKRIAARPKDLDHIDRLDKWMATGQTLDYGH